MHASFTLSLKAAVSGEALEVQAAGLKNVLIRPSV